MWRDRTPETKARYTVPAGSVTVNRYRGASVWMADYKSKLETFPEFSRYRSAPPDTSSIKRIKDRLQCKDFTYFIDKFYKIYHWAGYLPQLVFHLRDSISGLCLQRSHSSGLILTQCSDADAGQLWHRSNRDGNNCCSGYRNWNSDQCMTAGWVGGKASTQVCSVGGVSHEQFIKLNTVTKQLEVTKRKGACLGGELIPRPKALFSQCSAGGDQVLQSFRKVAVTDPGLASPDQSVEVVRLEDASRPGLCLAALGGSDSNRGRIEVYDCDPKSILQQFALIKTNDAFLRVEALGLSSDAAEGTRLCLDAGLGSSEIGLYPCYTEKNLNQNAKLIPSESLEDAAFKIEFRDSNCVSIPKEKKEDSSGTSKQPLEFHGCVSDSAVVKRGQTFEKVYRSGQNVEFSLRTKDGTCVSVDADHHFVLSKEACSSVFFTQDAGDIHKRLKHVNTGLCFDGNNGIRPMLYSCYEGENTNQQIDLSGGIIKLERTETCIDFEPVKPSPVTSIPCSVAESTFKWEEYKPFVPIETQVYNEKKGTTKAPLDAAQV
jgi:hypothetical protein